MRNTPRESDMPAGFGVLCFIVMFWSAVRYQFAYNAVVETRFLRNFRTT